MREGGAKPRAAASAQTPHEAASPKSLLTPTFHWNTNQKPELKTQLMGINPTFIALTRNKEAADLDRLAAISLIVLLVIPQLLLYQDYC
ncbi:hypothetical protein HMPREF0580_0605 [Mobiluncus mulieris ATCC 35239]|uniref:Uncharacterized protein n=2 Tax=Mobiluncus mulieris TaxID=2052 RepID=E0QNZ1_9ACTO|nr:hypothetical protein [Mobiluncus mulieris]EFM46724.1 hypothetical protein HMPREF0580_0605 [Mobiluncus mulieris ATCC 35239]MBB5846973.1 hypothetical protein [Mobiluncus mulieris]MCV0012323.1 hypothetical protein [Mobiluncus mulieris]NMW63427.1 hypothetical protein [Mobiluncus mulieris]NMW82042.1 hypothetical protein [Mobiluncus mulieris]